MPKKTKPRQAPKPPTFSGTLAQQLKQVAQAAPPTSDAKPARPAPPAPPAPQPTTDPTLEAAAHLDDADLFELALDKLDPKRIFAGKYSGEGPSALPKPPAPLAGQPSPQPQDAALPDEAPLDEAQLREQAIFMRTVGYIDRMERPDKYHKPKPGARQRFEALRERGYTTEHPEGLLTPLLPKEGPGLHLVELHEDQRGLLNRFKLTMKQQSCNTLNLHGELLEDALRQLELFIHQEHKRDAPYARVVHGKGLNSEANTPVLKPTVLTWLEGPGLRYIRGYAPEVGADGNYGSLVIALDTTPRHTTKP